MAAIKMKTTVKLEASAECPSHSRSDVSVRDLVFSIDEPVERKGTNSGPTPTDTALGALIGCTNVIGHKCADKLGLDIGHMTIDATCDFDRRGVTLQEEIEVPFETVTLTVTCNGPATLEQLEQLGAEVAKYCPLSKLFENSGTKLETHWRKS